jgi:hypothetical protein
MDKFEEVMTMMKQHAVAMDANLDTFTRVWVLQELHTAAMMRMQTQYIGAESEEAIDLLSIIPSAEDAKASVPDDKARIVAKIRQADGGVAAFDAIMSANIIKELCFNERGLLPGGRDAALDAVRKYPSCINSCSSRGLGGTLLMMAAAHGEVELLQELLMLSQSAKAININTQTSRGWTALHFAAVCFNTGSAEPLISSSSSSSSSSTLDNQCKIVSMLLDARCDPNILNSFQKTALEEFVINAHAHSSHAALRLLFTATAGARDLVNAFLSDDGDKGSVKVGDKVMVKCRIGREAENDEERDRRSDDDGVDMIKGKWYRGVIRSDDGDGSYDVAYDGSYDVAYDNSITEVRVPHNCITLYLW